MEEKTIEEIDEELGEVCERIVNINKQHHDKESAKDTLSDLKKKKFRLRKLRAEKFVDNNTGRIFGLK